MKFPKHGLVYDYSLEDGGVSRKRDDDEEEHKTGEVRERRERLGKDGAGEGRLDKFLSLLLFKVIVGSCRVVSRIP